MRHARLTQLLIALAVSTVLLVIAYAFERPFYSGGKTLRILVAIGAGGGLDTEARVLARHLPRHVPGNPQVIVENVPGAGGLVAANMFARTIKADGLSIGYFTLAPAIAQLIGDTSVTFDVRKFEFIGSPYPYWPACLFSVKSGVSSIADWNASTRLLKLGSTGRTSVTHVYPSILQRTLQLPTHVVTGYRGTSEIRHALANGELDGLCVGWDGVKGSWAGFEGAVVLQAGATPHPDLPDVPLAVTLASSDEARELLSSPIDAIIATGRPYALPPGTGEGPRRILRQAFLDTMRDPAYLADARRIGIAVDPISGEDVTRHVHALLTLPPRIAAKLQQVIGR
jgi:tripartite-type tricarboxylate transporter receptor subunit TctC